jgi:hypothetical protein
MQGALVGFTELVNGLPVVPSRDDSHMPVSKELQQSQLSCGQVLILVNKNVGRRPVEVGSLIKECDEVSHQFVHQTVAKQLPLEPEHLPQPLFAGVKTGRLILTVTKCCP